MKLHNNSTSRLLQYIDNSTSGDINDSISLVGYYNESNLLNQT